MDKKYEHLLVPIDFSAVTGEVIRNACNLGQAYSAEICLLHVADPDPAFVGYETGPQYVRDQAAATYCAERKSLETIKSRLEGCGVAAKALIVQGVAQEKIRQEAERFGADLIVMGLHGHGQLYHLLTGSVTEGVLKNAPCPVLVVKSPESSGAAPDHSTGLENGK